MRQEVAIVVHLGLGDTGASVPDDLSYEGSDVLLVLLQGLLRFSKGHTQQLGTDNLDRICEFGEASQQGSSHGHRIGNLLDGTIVELPLNKRVSEVLPEANS